MISFACIACEKTLTEGEFHVCDDCEHESEIAGELLVQEWSEQQTKEDRESEHEILS